MLSLLFIAASCSKNRCNKDVLGNYKIENSNELVFEITESNILLIGIDTTIMNYTIDCEEFCVTSASGGVPNNDFTCNKYTNDKGVFSWEGGLTLIKQ